MINGYIVKSVVALFGPENLNAWIDTDNATG